MQGLEIQKYLHIATRRKYWIIVPVLLSILGSTVYYLKAPRVYQAETLILVQAQRVPEDYVKPIVEGTVENRLRTISQQVTSRTNLEKIIEEYKINKEYKNSVDIDEVVSEVRKRIKIDVRSSERARETSTFTIAFQANNPETAMKVANGLASNFIGENLKIREEQALGTSSFLSDELESVRKRLAEKESDLKDYRERYMGGLPEQLQSTLNILERLENQSGHLGNSLSNAENRRNLIQTQIAERSRAGGELPLTTTENSRGMINLTSLRNELVSLEARYTNDHPDVKRHREMIASMERQSASMPGNSESGRETSMNTGIDITLRNQLKEINLEIGNLREEIKNTRAQISLYRKRIEDTPKREQELLSLNRDYENLKGNFNSLLNRKLEADIAVSMERKQKGEQFRIIDPAKKPTRPIKPQVEMILLMTLAFGLGLGGALAYFIEVADTSYRNPEDIEKELRVPVLMSIPVRYTEQELKKRRRAELVKVASISAGFATSVVGIVVITIGFERILHYIYNLLGRI